MKLSFAFLDDDYYNEVHMLNESVYLIDGEVPFYSKFRLRKEHQKFIFCENSEMISSFSILDIKDDLIHFKINDSVYYTGYIIKEEINYRYFECNHLIDSFYLDLSKRKNQMMHKINNLEK
jgi:hypothetical protein